MGELLFGYRSVKGIKPCPCLDPGNYLKLERIDGLECEFQCWCGRKMGVDFDSNEELLAFLKEHDA